MGIIQSIKSYLHLQRDILYGTGDILNKQLAGLYYQQRVDYLTDKCLNSEKAGVSDARLCNEEVVVSLTTFGTRLFEVYLAIESIMQGTVKPNRIVLWLSNELENEALPQTLLNQQRRGLEICYCRDVRSYTKLLPALNKYPNSNIITIDDDILYPVDLVENLVYAHKMAPNCVCANRVHSMPSILGTNYTPMNTWPMYEGRPTASQRFLCEGYAGALYPPKVFDSEIFNEEVFMADCKYADDVWFKAMELKCDVPVYYANVNREISEFLVNPRAQKVALKNRNNGVEQLNDKQLRTVFERYDLYKKLR